MSLNKTLLGTAIALALASGTAHAYRIDPFGTGGATVINVGSLGWNNGNAISTPLSVASGSVVSAVVGDTIQTYGHAALQGFNDLDGNGIAGLPAFGTEWTYIFGFAEKVTSVTNGGNTFDFATTSGGTNFFEVRTSAANSSNLSGLGFKDGTLLLSGSIDAFNSATGAGKTSFSATDTTTLPNLDQFPNATAASNNYPGYHTVTGSGGGTLNVTVSYANPLYFLDPLVTLSFNFQTFLNLAFQQTNPSSCFETDTAAIVTGAGNGLGCGSTGDFGTIGEFNGLRSGIVPVLDPITGLPVIDPITGLPKLKNYTEAPNTLLQTRGTNNLPNAVPEPGMLALVGLGLAGIAARRRRVHVE